MAISSKELLAFEKLTIEKIATLKPFEAFAGLRQEAIKMRRAVDPDRGGLDFHAVMQLNVLEQKKQNRRQDRPRRFDVGGLVEVENPSRSITRSSYLVVIGKGADHSKPILRKIHFDFEPAQFRNLAEPKPSMHLQYGGDLLPQWKDGKGYTMEKMHHLSPWFEKPRIPCFPTCLALLLDWIFLEFSHNRYASAVVTNSDWSAHVRAAEEKIIEPFITDCHSFIQKAKVRKERWLHQQCYEMPV
jgi:hypothetical protein